MLFKNFILSFNKDDISYVNSKRFLHYHSSQYLVKSYDNVILLKGMTGD